MSKCVKSTLFGDSDVLIRFIESIHVGGRPLQVDPNAEILFNPRNLETLVRSVDMDKLNVVATKYEIEEKVVASVINRLDEQLDKRLSAFEARIEQLLNASKSS